MKLLFDGRFEPCCRGDRFGTKHDVAGTSHLHTGPDHIAVKVFTTSQDLVWTYPEDEDADPVVLPNAEPNLDEPPLGTRRFYHGTNVAAAHGIITEGITTPSDDVNDFGSGFYMASTFEVAASFASDHGWPSRPDAAGHGDHCVIVLDIDQAAYVCVFPSLRTL